MPVGIILGEFFLIGQAGYQMVANFTDLKYVNLSL
jgi:hypothetical protein